jgi:hypothetical protein
VALRRLFGADPAEAAVIWLQAAAFIWAVSAAVCLEVYGELYGPEFKKRWVAISIGSLIPVLNTLIALDYARQKLRR